MPKGEVEASRSRKTKPVVTPSKHDGPMIIRGFGLSDLLKAEEKLYDTVPRKKLSTR